MKKSDNLTIEEAEELKEKGFSASCMVDVPSGEKLGFIGKQLLDVMRENERLRSALLSIGGETIYRRDVERNVFFPMLEANARIIDALSNKESDNG